MAIVVTFEAPGMTAEQYDGLMRELDLQTTPPDGGLAHIAGPVEGGWRVVDVWESREKLDAFVRDRLGPVMQNQGVERPNVTVGPVHAMFAAPTQ